MGAVHEKGLCVWCMKPSDKRHKDHDNFRVLQRLKTWYKFKTSVAYVEDTDLKKRLHVLIDSTGDPLAAKICYHESCFKKYMRPVYDPELEDHMPHVDYADVKQKFFLACL